MKLKLYEILPTLYQSARTHTLSLPEKKLLVKQYRINIVVNLWHTADTEMIELLTHNGFWKVDCGYIHRSMGDGKNTEAFQELIQIADVLVPCMRNGSVVLSHCYGGRNRSGLLNAIIVMKWFQCDGGIALEYIQQRRPNSLVNKTFSKWLQEQTYASLTRS